MKSESSRLTEVYLSTFTSPIDIAKEPTTTKSEQDSDTNDEMLVVGVKCELVSIDNSF